MTLTLEKQARLLSPNDIKKDMTLYTAGGTAENTQILHLKMQMDEEPNESLWVRIKGRAGTDDIIVGVCYRPT